MPTSVFNNPTVCTQFQQHLFLFLCSLLNSCGCSTAKSKTPQQRLVFLPITGTEHGSQPYLTTRDRELVFVLELRFEPGDLNLRPMWGLSLYQLNHWLGGRVLYFIKFIKYIWGSHVILMRTPH